MNNKVDDATRTHFRDWLRDQLRHEEFYQRRGDHYLIREFAKYCVDRNAPIDEASLGRYLRDDDPVLPTPERCRALATVLGYPPIKVLVEAGYLEGTDLLATIPENTQDLPATADALQRLIPVEILDLFLTQIHDHVQENARQRSQESDPEKGLASARSA